MRVLLYEHILALGLGRDLASREHSLYREGRAMRDALAADLARVPGVEVVSYEPWPENWVTTAARETDAQIVIAPEFEGILFNLTKRLEDCSGQVIGPSSEAVTLTTDKLRLAEHWRDLGVRTPATSDREPTPCEIFPLVWKPRDGAGSTATFRLDRGTDIARCRAIRAAEGHTGEMLMQEFVSGTAVSVAFLVGPAQVMALPPCFQRLSGAGRFKYSGGATPIPAALAARAESLARQAIDCVPGLRGWVGVDVVLGNSEDGSHDYAIEINPRLTTSYVGLRHLCEGNLADAMLRIAKGETVALTWTKARISFGSEGTVRQEAI